MGDLTGNAESTKSTARGGRRFEASKVKSFLASDFFTADYEVVAGDASELAYLGGVHLGAVDVLRHEAVGVHRGHRRLQHYRQDHIDDFLISVPVRGRTTVMQAKSSIAIEAGTFIISATAKPITFTSESANSHSTFQTYHVKVSGSMLRVRVPQIDLYCHHPIKIDNGAGEIMTAMFALAIKQGAELTLTQARNFGGMVIDAIANATRDAPELVSFHPDSRQTAYARIRDEAGHFIACNLSNPALDPALVAKHCGISVRHLHAAYAATAQTLGSVIKETRLKGCRMALQSAELRERTVFEIAMRWGFSDPAYFSRAYKAMFGVSPRADRDRA